MNLSQVAAFLTSMTHQASEQANGFGGWVSGKTGELKDKFSEVVWPSVIPSVSVEKDKDKEPTVCPVESAADLPFPYTGSTRENNRDLLENVLSAPPQTFTGRFNGILSSNAQKPADGTKAEPVPPIQTNNEEVVPSLVSTDESPQTSSASRLRP